VESFYALGPDKGPRRIYKTTEFSYITKSEFFLLWMSEGLTFAPKILSARDGLTDEQGPEIFGFYEEDR